jgi:DNA-binding NtrC family response regulator
MLYAFHAGKDSSLLKTRAGVLALTGMTVRSAGTVAEALALVAGDRFDVAILCHTLASAEITAVAGAFHRRNSRAPVLLVARGRELFDPVPADVDGVLDPHPEALVRELCGYLSLSSANVRQAHEGTAVHRSGSGTH